MITHLNTKYEVDTISHSDTLDEWDRFVDISPQGCIFCRSWWLRATAGTDFEILVLRKQGRIVAGIPLVSKIRYGHRYIGMPQLTQTLGALLSPSTKTSYERRLSEGMNLLENLVMAMPDFAHFSCRFHYDLTNWLPFFWAGYEQTTRYTYLLPDLSRLEEVFAGFAHMKRKNIKKAEQNVEIRQDLSARDFHSHHTMTLSKQEAAISYPLDLFERIYETTYDRQAGRTWYAADNHSNIHAAIFVVYDAKSAYYLLSSIDPDYRWSGATTLLLKEAITYSARFTNTFDFEGSMIKGVEHSFRKFGARLTPYFHIVKDNRPLYIRAWQGLRQEVKKGIKPSPK